MTLIGVQNPVWLAIKAIFPEIQFASLYESFQALTSIQVSHFVEWFSGNNWDSIWTLKNNTGSGTASPNDAIDGGFNVISGAVNNANTIMNFNDKRHYDPTGAILIAIIERVSGNTTAKSSTGFCEEATFANDFAFVINDNARTFYELETSDASVSSAAASDIVVDITTFHVHKIECGSADIKLTIDGVLKVTKTTNRPTTPQQPFIHGGVGNEGGASGFTRVRYMEVFNTSITILSSLYERLSALTQIMNQRLVETFSGALLNERWITENLVGTNTFEMDDAIDGGFRIVTGAGGSDNGQIDFSDKRQYDPTNCVLIGVVKKTSTTNTRTRFGYGNTAFNVGNDVAYMEANTQNTNFGLQTSNGGISFTASSLVLDANFHTHKLEGSAGDTKLFIDGVLEITKTTDRPTLKCQPTLYVLDLASSSAKTGQIRYLEIYNKLTTETLIPSVFELFNPLTTIARQHFWEWFDGSDLSNRWITESIGGTGTFAMDDAIDLGFKITSPAVDGALGTIHFNEKRHYDPTDSIIISVSRLNETTNFAMEIGLISDVSVSQTLQTASLNCGSPGTFRLRTGNATSSSLQDTSLSVDTVFHTSKVECGSADIKLFMDGVLEVTKTTFRPTVKLQPFAFTLASGSTAARSMNVRYIEALNT